MVACRKGKSHPDPRIEEIGTDRLLLCLPNVHDLYISGLNDWDDERQLPTDKLKRPSQDSRLEITSLTPSSCELTGGNTVSLLKALGPNLKRISFEDRRKNDRNGWLQCLQAAKHLSLTSFHVASL